MGTIANLMISIGAETAGALAGFAAVKAGAGGMSSAMSGGMGAATRAVDIAGKGLFAYGTALAGIGGIAAKVGIGYAASLESSTVAWTTLLGSQESAVTMLKDIEKFAANTPFSKMGVDQMAKYLNNAGFEGQALFDQLTKIGDMGGAFNIQEADLAEMTRQYSQVQQAGVAYTEDLNILQNKGIPIYKALSETLGISTADVKKWASEGKISAEVYNKAMDQVAAGVAGGMTAQSQTFNGMISTMKDNFSSLAGTLSKDIFEDLKGSLQGAMEVFPAFSEALTGIFNGENIEANGAKLAASIQTVFNSLGAAAYNLMPALLDTFNGVFLGIFGALVSGLPTMIGDMLPFFIESFFRLIDGILSFLPTMIPLLIQGGIILIGGLLEGMAQSMGLVMEMMPALLQSIVAIVTQNAPLFITSGMDFIMAMITGLTTALPMIIEALIAIMPLLATAILTNLPLIMEAGIQLLVAVILGIAQMMPELIPVIIQCVLIINKALLDNLPLLINAGLQLVVAIITGIIQQLPALLSRGIMVVVSLTATILGALPMILGAGVQILANLLMGFVSGVGGFLSSVGSFISNVVTNIKNGIAGMAAIGGSLVSGLWQGISDKAGWLLGQVTGFASSIKTGIMKFFNIKSPSKVFRDEIGKNLALGIGLGFTDEMGSVVSNMTRALPKTLETDMSLKGIGGAPVQGAASNQGSGQGGGIVIHIAQFINNTDKDLEALAEELGWMIDKKNAAGGIVYA